MLHLKPTLEHHTNCVPYKYITIKIIQITRFIRKQIQKSDDI